MKSEREKMTAGELYNALADELMEDRIKAKEVAKRFNDTEVRETELRKSMLVQFLGSTSSELCIEQPFYCCYGYNFRIGARHEGY